MHHCRFFSLGKATSPAKEEATPVAFVPRAHAERAATTPPRDPVTTPSSYPDPEEVGAQWGQDAYKIQRLQEMATIWKGTSLESDTVKLLAMLLQEDGTLTAERRHDCSGGVCYAMGIMGHHICQRGTPIIYGEPFEKYCSWKGGVSPQKQFEKDYPGFATEWRVQFQEYTLRMKQCREAKISVRQCIQNWNPNEVGRIAKVEKQEPLVRAALGL